MGRGGWTRAKRTVSVVSDEMFSEFSLSMMMTSRFNDRVDPHRAALYQAHRNLSLLISHSLEWFIF